ncbi:MAG: NAD(P)H-dependent glycerol-3-phosphate dehydrogenase [Allosphingosinicella sp.]
MIDTIGILGAGAWGTALAVAANRAGRRVILQAHDPEVARAIESERVNVAYLPGIAIDRRIQTTSDPSDAVSKADAVLLAAPAQHMRQVLRRCAPAWPAGVPAVICAKGIEQNTCALMSEVVERTIGDAPVCVLSGPSFAAEVARELPTAVTLASAHPRLRESLPAALGTPAFRIYCSDDVIGAQLGGAIQNVLAIACGIIEGKELGENARAALITRGLAEMARFAVALNAQPETLTGLTGLGDLVLTCNAMQSRNFSLGVALGKGRPLRDILGERNSVAEGVHTAAAAVEMSRRAGIEMPICAAVDAVLNQGAGLDEMIAGLLARPRKAEVFAA